MIEVVHVTHHFGVRPVVSDVSLTIEAGEIIALMGPNGTGKTTLLTIIAGALSPLEGHVEINGLRRRSTAENELAIRKRVFYLPADAWLPRANTPREWLMMIGQLYGISPSRLLEHVPQVLALFGLESQADQRIPSCSTGQRKKVALAGAIVSEAPILLLDEPFSGGLDPSGIMALKRLFQHHRQRGDRTIVMSTPVPELTEDLADRIAIIRDGKIAAFDTMEGLQQKIGAKHRLDEIFQRVADPDSTRGINAYFTERL